MQRKIWLVPLVVAVLLIGSTAWAQGLAEPPTGAGITSLPYTINNSGPYFVTRNLTYRGTNIAIAVNADDVTLDLKGFSLTGPGATSNASGIVMKGRSNVEVRNGTVRGFNAGVAELDLIEGKNHRIIDVRATDNSTGISLNGKNHLIRNCSGSNNTSDGIYIGSGLMTDSVANSNGNLGIWMSPGPGSVLGNIACNNVSGNFSLGGGGPTSIFVDRNSAFGLDTNYRIDSETTGVVITGNNSGMP
jgi:hypothetical protein